MEKKKTQEELKKTKKEKEKKQKLQESLRKEKEKYYAYHSDIKTSARDNGEW